MNRPGHRVGAGLLTTSIALCVVALGSGMSATADPSPCDPGWQVRSTPVTQQTIFYGVKVISPDDVWAVGQISIPGHRPLAEHWDGAEWRVVATPEQRGTFLAVSGTATDDVWAVGHWFEPDGRGGVLTEHWDGAQWSVVRAPSPDPDAELTGVKAFTASDVWAVGRTGSYQPLTEHWDGSRWSIVPVLMDPVVVLLAVDGVASDDLWAVGYAVTGTFVPVILHWDGAVWTRVRADARPRGTYRVLHGVAAAGARDVWAVGDMDPEDSGYLPYYMHWDGTGWRSVRVPGSAAGGRLSAVAAGPGSGMWAVGGYGSGSAGTITEQGRQGQWRRVPSPSPFPNNNGLNAVSVSSGGATWAVGFAGGQALALQWCPRNPP